MTYGISPAQTLNTPQGSTIQVHRFYTTYEDEYEVEEVHNAVTGHRFTRPRLTGQKTEVDWVTFSPVGQAKVVINEKVARVLKVQALAGSEQNPAIMMAHMRASVIGPLYENWKRGQDPKLSGIPLAAWPGVSPEQANALKMRNIHSVEDLSMLTDIHFQSYGIPNLRHLVENAKRFLDAQDQTHITEKLAEKDLQISALSDTVVEMRAMMEQQARQIAELASVGRAPNVGPVPALETVVLANGEGGHVEQTGNDESLFADETENEAAPTRRRR